MTYTEFATALAASNIPTAYGYFSALSNQKPPCVTYAEAYTRNKSAGNSVYKKIVHFDVFLFTLKKDLASEAALETALSAIGFWNKTSEEYITDEKHYQSIYEIEVLIDG